MKSVLRIVIVAVAVAAVVVVIYLLAGSDKGPTHVVERYTVRRGTIEQTIQGTGVLECATAATILSKVEGKLGEPQVEEGEEVGTEQVLIVITNDEIATTVNLKKAEIAQLEEELEELSKDPDDRTAVKKAKAAYDRAETEYRRKQDLLDDEEAKDPPTLLSKRALEELREDVAFAKREAELAEDAYEEAKKEVSEADVQEAEEKVAQAKAELEKLEEQADGRQVRSPIAGTVLKVMIEPEAIAVEPDKVYPKDTPLFVVADLDSILVRGQVYQNDGEKLERDRIAAGEYAAKVHLSGRERVLDGTLTYLSRTLIESSTGVNQFEVKIEFAAPPAGLTAGLQVAFDVTVERIENVPVVPVRFVELRGPKAYVQKAGGREPVEVRLGASDNNHYQVLGGLSEGDVIVWERTAR